MIGRPSGTVTFLFTDIEDFHSVPEAAGLPTAHVDGNDDLDVLIEELFVVADEIDAARTD